MHSVIVAMPLSYYPLGAQIMTLVLPLGFFIVVMTACTSCSPRRTRFPDDGPSPGPGPSRPMPGPRRDMSAAIGFPTAPSGGGKAPLADRGTPPAVGARTEEALRRPRRRRPRRRRTTRAGIR